MEHGKKLHKFRMTESMHDGILIINSFFLAALVNILVDPFVDRLGVNLEGPHETGEKFDAPWVPKDVLHI